MTNKAIALFCFTLLIASCKDKAEPAAETAETTGSEPVVTQEVVPPAPVMNKPDPDFISKSKTQKDKAEVVDQVWHYYFALSIKDPTPKKNLYEGQWLDLKPGGTFARGLYQDTTEKGFYLYSDNGSEGLLELRSDTAASEWKVKYDPSNMLLIGTAKYGNNPWQIKLKRSDKLPEAGNGEK
ncbi:MAG: hypothetical protein IT266_11110 [Saprospiraceae bacterium]|nr:hypothetical protein [Saprospiraceae bacterium]